MKIRSSHLAIAALVVSLASFAGPREDAQAMVESAATHAKSVGEAKALQDFMKDPEWKRGELFVFAFDGDGKVLASGAYPKLVGRNLADIKDPTGKPWVKDMLALAAKAPHAGWVEYEWVNPETKKMTTKISYVKRIDGSTSLVGVGYHKD